MRRCWCKRYFCKRLFHKKGDNVDLNGTIKSHLISKKLPWCIPMSEVRMKCGKVVCKVSSQVSHTNLNSATHPTEVAVHHNKKKENCMTMVVHFQLNKTITRNGRFHKVKVKTKNFDFSAFNFPAIKMHGNLINTFTLPQLLVMSHRCFLSSAKINLIE